jgi:hypothetical protein
VSAQNSACQPPHVTIQEPTTGAIAGARPKIALIIDISFCASGPSKTSRIKARPTIRPTPALIPGSARNASSADIDWATRPADAIRKHRRRHRPLATQASDSAPISNDSAA